MSARKSTRTPRDGEAALKPHLVSKHLDRRASQSSGHNQFARPGLTGPGNPMLQSLCIRCFRGDATEERAEVSRHNQCFARQNPRSCGPSRPSIKRGAVPIGAADQNCQDFGGLWPSLLTGSPRARAERPRLNESCRGRMARASGLVPHGTLD